nr:glycosyltransferase [Hyphomicrobium methylovorum]
MPTLNQGRFIKQSIESVLTQDYSELELVVADGGSSDNTHGLLTDMSTADPRLRWSSQRDTGPAEALNRALRGVQGTIVGWLNSDDLYTPGAIQSAVNAFAAQPDWIMTYGHGEHVDEEGTVLAPYPTLRPDGPIERFSNGCFICQPTVFFQRSMYLLLGALDNNLKASFDFDYWLRAFRAFQDRIGFIDAVQAQSRLHDACITKTARRTVALEGVRVVARHMGTAPTHWFVTYIEELLHQAPPEGDGHIEEQLRTALDEVKDCFEPNDLRALQEQLRYILPNDGNR